MTSELDPYAASASSVRSTSDDDVFVYSVSRKLKTTRRRTPKKRSRKVTLRPVNSPVVSSRSAVETDIWDLKKLKEKYENLSCDVDRWKHIALRTNAPTTFGVRKTIHVWRGSRLKDQCCAQMAELQSTIDMTEEGIRLWLSAVVTQKWSYRREAMALINDLDASIALHECRLDNIDERLCELKQLARKVRDGANQFAGMLVFNEAIATAAQKCQQDVRTGGAIHEGKAVCQEVLSHSECREILPSNATTEGEDCHGQFQDVSLRRDEQRLQRWTDTFVSHWQRLDVKADFSNDQLHDELSAKLKTCASIVGQLTHQKSSLRKIRRREIILLAIANRTKKRLKKVSGFSRSTAASYRSHDNHPGGVEEMVVSTDGRNFFVANESDSEGSGASEGGYQRGGLNDTLTSRIDQQKCVQLMLECEGELLMIAQSEDKVKDALVKVIELKLECEELSAELMKNNLGDNCRESGNIQTGPKIPVVLGIIWGSSGVPMPVPMPPVSAADVDITSSRTCRAASLQTTVDYLDFCDDRLSSQSEPQLSEEDDRVRSLLKRLRAEDQSFGRRSNPLYIQELKNSDLSTILRSLLADKVYLNIKEATYFPKYFDFSRVFQSNDSTESIKKRGDRSYSDGSGSGGCDDTKGKRSNSFSDSLLSISSLLSGLVSGNTRENCSEGDCADDSSFCCEGDQSGDKYSMSVGFGLIYEETALSHNTTALQDEKAAVYLGESNVLGVFMQDNTYETVLRALSFRDYLEKEACSMSPIPVVIYSSETRKWSGLGQSWQDHFLLSFPKKCPRTVCTAACRHSVCRPPSLPVNSPTGMGICLSKYAKRCKDRNASTDTDKDTCKKSSNVKSLPPSGVELEYFRFLCSWKSTSSGSILERIFPVCPLKGPESEGNSAEQCRIWSVVEMGMLECVGSLNVEGASTLLSASAPSLMAFSSSILSPPDEVDAAHPHDCEVRLKVLRSTVNCGCIVAPFEAEVAHLHAVLGKHDGHELCEERGGKERSVLDKGCEMLSVLGSVRIILATSLGQSSRRMDLACDGLARWIDLSSSVAFRVMSSFYVPVSNSDSSDNDDDDGSIKDCGQDEEFLGMVGSQRSRQASQACRGRAGRQKKDTWQNRRYQNRESFSIKKKSEKLDALLHKRIPILGSVGVKVRAELYQDLLHMQLKSSSCSHKLPGDAGTCSGIVGCFGADYKTMLWLCRLLVSVGKNKAMKVVSDDLRLSMRFHVLQYILGLDERWSLSQTVAACQLIIQCLNESNSNGSDRLAVPRDVDVGTQFVTFKGRKSLILSEASLNILVGSLPTYLYGAQCSVRFSISSGGGSLFSLLHAAESAPYQACLLVVRDSFGHMFGGFVSQPLKKQRDYYGNGTCFVFSVFPATKIYSWTKKNDYFCHVSDRHVCMGGGGEGFAFLLDDELSLGSSNRSETFQNPPLSFKEQFQCTELELLTFE